MNVSGILGHQFEVAIICPKVPKYAENQWYRTNSGSLDRQIITTLLDSDSKWWSDAFTIYTILHHPK